MNQAREAATYADYAGKDAHRAVLSRFIARVPRGARVLDFGCGSGWAGAEMLAHGLDVEGYDGAEGLAAEARARHGLTVTVGTFAEFNAPAGTYDAIWASFCLLHDSREAMPGHLKRLSNALKPGGLLYVSLKEGEGSSRDRHGRFYTYFTRDEMREHFRQAGLARVELETANGIDYAGQACTYLHMFAT